MIIESYGIDPFVAQAASKALQPLLATLPITQNPPPLWLAHEPMMFHHGVDQHAWIVLIKITLSYQEKGVEIPLQDHVLHVLEGHVIHVQFMFQYIEDAQNRLIVNPSYPLTITEKNEVVLETKHDTDTDIFLGNAFEASEVEEEIITSPKTKKGKA
jgi:hypothetical protein